MCSPAVLVRSCVDRWRASMKSFNHPILTSVKVVCTQLHWYDLGFLQCCLEVRWSVQSARSHPKDISVCWRSSATIWCNNPKTFERCRFLRCQIVSGISFKKNAHRFLNLPEAWKPTTSSGVVLRNEVDALFVTLSLRSSSINGCSTTWKEAKPWLRPRMLPRTMQCSNVSIASYLVMTSLCPTLAMMPKTMLWAWHPD